MKVPGFPGFKEYASVRPGPTQSSRPPVSFLQEGHGTAIRYQDNNWRTAGHAVAAESSDVVYSKQNSLRMFVERDPKPIRSCLI